MISQNNFHAQTVFEGKAPGHGLDSFFYLWMFPLIYSAPDNIPKADEIRTLVKDIWDLRIAKLRSSIDIFVKSDVTHAKVIYCFLSLVWIA